MHSFLFDKPAIICKLLIDYGERNDVLGVSESSLNPQTHFRDSHYPDLFEVQVRTLAIVLQPRVKQWEYLIDFNFERTLKELHNFNIILVRWNFTIWTIFKHASYIDNFKPNGSHIKILLYPWNETFHILNTCKVIYMMLGQSNVVHRLVLNEHTILLI